MPRRSARRLPAYAIDLAIAAPQVVADRLARVARAGATPSARDVAEFHRMGAEKIVAFGAAWQAMALAAMRAQQAYLRAVSLAMRSPWWIAPHRLADPARRTQDSIDVLTAGLAPIRHAAVGNARRLGRARRRKRA
jgi:hypothetical protein